MRFSIEFVYDGRAVQTTGYDVDIAYMQSTARL